MRIGTCIPCQYGDHDGHVEIIQAVPEGMMGGAVCGCKGECINRRKAEAFADEAARYFANGGSW